MIKIRHHTRDHSNEVSIKESIELSARLLDCRLPRVRVTAHYTDGFIRNLRYIRWPMTTWLA